MTTDQAQSLIDDLDIGRLNGFHHDVDGNPHSYEVRIANEYHPLTITVPADSPRAAAEAVADALEDGTIGPPECGAEAYELAHRPDDADPREYVYKVGSVTAAEDEGEALGISEEQIARGPLLAS